MNLKHKFFILISAAFNFADCQNIYVNSIPKAGTHLVTKCIQLLTGKKPLGYYTNDVLKNGIPAIKSHELFYAHLPFNNKINRQLNKLNFKSLLVIRDPRDQLISQAFWVKEDPSRDLSGSFKEKTIPQIIDILIDHIDNMYKSYMPWLNNKNFCLIKFESLIGAQGNGNNNVQKNEILKICNHLKIRYTSGLIDYTIKNLFGNSPTFRKGQIGTWKKYFTAEHKAKFKQIAGQLLIDLGYEKDLNW